MGTENVSHAWHMEEGRPMMVALAAQVPACSECALTGISALETWGQSQAGETIPHQSLILSAHLDGAWSSIL